MSTAPLAAFSNVPAPTSAPSSAGSTPTGTTESSKAITQVAIGRSLEVLPIGRIVLAEQPRTRYRGIEELAGNLKVEGMLQPITVRPGPKDRYTVLYGHRRFLAARVAGLTEVLAIINHDVQDDDVLSQQLAENAHRDPMDPIDEARAIRKWMHQKRIATYAEAAQLLGYSMGWVTDRVVLLKLSQADQERVSRGELGIGAGAKLARVQTGNTRRSNTVPRRVAPPPPIEVTRTATTRTVDDTHHPAALHDASRPTAVDAAAVQHYFGDSHPLAETARKTCWIAHECTNPVNGGVACGQCWEATVRQHERQTSWRA